jgi:hypothetical protein
VKQNHFFYWNDFYEYLSLKYQLPLRSGNEVDQSKELMEFCGILFTHQTVQEYEDTNQFPETGPAILTPVNKATFTKPTCFVLINYKLSQVQPNLIAYYEKYCDRFIYTNFKNQQMDNLIHDDAKLALILQRYAIQMEYPPVGFDQEKHIIDKNQIILKLKSTFSSDTTKAKPTKTYQEEEDNFDGFNLLGFPGEESENVNEEELS